VQALDQAAPEDRWRDVFERTFALVTGSHHVAQVPQLEGDRDHDLKVFGGRFESRAAPIAIVAVSSDGLSVTLRSGASSGVTSGSVYRLDGPKHTPTGSPPEIEVTAVEAFSSRAAVVRGNFHVGDLVAEVKHAYALTPIKLFVGGDFAEGIDRERVRNIQEGLRGLGGFALTDDKTQADWWVYVVRPKEDLVAEARAAMPEVSVPEGRPYIWVVDRLTRLMHESMRIDATEPTVAIAKLLANLESYAWSREIRRLALAGGPVPIELRMSIWTADPSCTDCSQPRLLSYGDPMRYRKTGPMDPKAMNSPPKGGDIVTFQLHNTDKRSWNAYLLAIGPDAAVWPLHPSPNKNSEAAEIASNKSTGDTIGGYKLANAGIETIMLVVTSEPIPIVVLSHPGMARKGAPDSELGKLLTEAAARIGAFKGEVGKWSAMQLNFRLSD